MNECAHEHTAVFTTGHMWVGTDGVEDDYRDVLMCVDCGCEIVRDTDEADDDIPF